jgi:ABC-type nitrate/sulfonate/bicarbonate transport system substrate-binding protein
MLAARRPPGKSGFGVIAEVGIVLRKLTATLVLALLAGGSLALRQPALAADAVVKVGYAKCAHCMPMALTPGLAKGITIEATGFNTGNDVLTALVSKSIDVAQVTYLHYVTALDKGFDVVAISGEVNGGSECVSAPALNLAKGDWATFRALADKAKKAGAPLKVAASRGAAQDIHMRGAFARQGLDVNKDLQFVNIPNPSDHLAAIRRGEIDMTCITEPFAAQIRLADAGRTFVQPYDQAAGTLTNIIVARSDMIAARRADVQATVAAVVALVDLLKGDNGKSAWTDVITRLTGLDRTVATAALDNAFPDYALHRTEALAIARMMKDLKYVATDVTPAIEKTMDYSFLEAVTKRHRNELGY